MSDQDKPTPKSDEERARLMEREAWLKNITTELQKAIDAFVIDGLDEYEISSDAGKNVVKRTKLNELIKMRETFNIELTSIQKTLYPDDFKKARRKAKTIHIRRSKL